MRLEITPGTSARGCAQSGLSEASAPARTARPIVTPPIPNFPNFLIS